MENEVIAGREILALAAELAEMKEPESPQSGTQKVRYYRNGKGVTIISCPRCGRNGFDTHGFTARWLDTLYTLQKDRVIAIMGCAVNGPGEARHADLGITGAGNKVLIFRHGKVERTIDAADADAAFAEELEKL
jgi:(E)-4-hydroxy-3-methylbut-2-enyl-diphosphate synthase